MDPNNPIFAVDPPEPEVTCLDIWSDDVLIRWRALPHHSMTSLLGAARAAAEEHLLSRPFLSEEIITRIIHVLAYIYDSSSPLLALDVVCYAFGLIGRSGESMDQIARRHGISRQAFSTRVQEACEAMYLQPRGSMRSRADKIKYTAVQRARWQEINQDAPV